MAKKLEGSRMLSIMWDRTTYTLRHTSYPAPRDTVDHTVFYDRLGGDESQRALTAGELSGTMQAFLDGCDTTYKTTESIT